MSNDRTCINCDHWQSNDNVYSCNIGEERPWFACAKWHRIRTEEEKKDAAQTKQIMKDNDGLFKGLAKL